MCIRDRPYAMALRTIRNCAALEYRRTVQVWETHSSLRRRRLRLRTVISGARLVVAVMGSSRHFVPKSPRLSLGQHGGFAADPVHRRVGRARWSVLHRWHLHFYVTQKVKFRAEKKKKKSERQLEIE